MLRDALAAASAAIFVIAGCGKIFPANLIAKVGEPAAELRAQGSRAQSSSVKYSEVVD